MLSEACRMQHEHRSQQIHVQIPFSTFSAELCRECSEGLQDRLRGTRCEGTRKRVETPWRDYRGVPHESIV